MVKLTPVAELLIKKRFFVKNFNVRLSGESTKRCWLEQYSSIVIFVGLVWVAFLSFIEQERANISAIELSLTVKVKDKQLVYFLDFSSL